MSSHAETFLSLLSSPLALLFVPWSIAIERDGGGRDRDASSAHLKEQGAGEAPSSDGFRVSCVHPAGRRPRMWRKRLGSFMEISVISCEGEGRKPHQRENLGLSCVVAISFHPSTATSSYCFVQHVLSASRLQGQSHVLFFSRTVQTGGKEKG